MGQSFSRFVTFFPAQFLNDLKKTFTHSLRAAQLRSYWIYIRGTLVWQTLLLTFTSWLQWPAGPLVHYRIFVLKLWMTKWKIKWHHKTNRSLSRTLSLSFQADICLRERQAETNRKSHKSCFFNFQFWIIHFSRQLSLSRSRSDSNLCM